MIKNRTLATLRTSISMVSNSEATIREQLDHCLKKAVEHSIDSQHPSGAWEATPDPRVFETALVGYALSRTPGDACAAAVDRAKQWLTHAAPQRHSPIALLIEESVKSILFHEIYRARTEDGGSALPSSLTTTRPRQAILSTLHRHRIQDEPAREWLGKNFELGIT